MRQVCCMVWGAMMAFVFAGCGDSPPESGAVPFKATNSPEIEALTKRMTENAKGKVYTKKTVEATEPKPADTKPAADPKKE